MAEKFAMSESETPITYKAALEFNQSAERLNASGGADFQQSLDVHTNNMRAILQAMATLETQVRELQAKS